MSVVTYDQITNSADLINYIQGSTNLYMYPDSNTTTVSGPIWLPKIYGKDLTAFEIASSGKIAITINDVHSIDVSNSNYGAAANSNIITTMNTKSNYAMEFMTNNRDLKVVLDSYSNDMYIHAASNIFIDTVSKDVQVSVGRDLLLNTTSNIGVSAQNGDLKMYANNSNMYVNMLKANNTIDVYSSSNMNVYIAKDIKTVASNNYTLIAECNVDIKSTNASIFLSANLDNQYIKLNDVDSNIDMYSSSNMNIYAVKDIKTVASNNYTVISECNVDISSTNASLLLSANLSNMYIRMNESSNMNIYSSSNISTVAAKDITVTSCNNYTLVSDCNVDISSTNASLLLSANLSNMYVRMVDVDSNISIYSSKNITTVAARDISVTACNNYTLVSDCNVDIKSTNASVFLSANLGNQYIKMNDVDSNIDMYSSSNMNVLVAKDITIVASNNYNLVADCNVDIKSTNASIFLSANLGNQYIKMNDVDSNIDMYSSSNMNVYIAKDIKTVASNNYTLISECNVDISSTNASLLLSANLSNMYIRMNENSNLNIYSSSNITTVAAKDISVTSCNNYTLASDCNVDISSTNASLLLSANQSNMYIRMLESSNINIYSSSNITTVAAKDISVTSCNNYTLASDCNVDISSTNASLLLSANQSNMYVRMNDVDSNMSIYSSANITTVAAKDISITACNNYTLASDCNIDISSTNASLLLSANLSNMYIRMTDTDSNMRLYTSCNMNTVAAKDINVTSCNVYKLTSASNIDISSTNANVLLSANQGNQYINMYNSESNISIYSSSNMNVVVMKDINTTASNSYALNVNNKLTINSVHDESLVYSQCNLFLSSHDSNMYLRMAAPGDTITLFGLSNMTLNTSNDLSVYARTNIYQYTSNLTTMCYDNMIVTACNNMYITACNNIHMEALDTIDIEAETVNIITRSDISYTALSNLNFYISSTPNNPQDAIFQISGGMVKVRGDMVITGSINTSNIINTTVVQENLKVTDKIILLANVGDGSSNDMLPLDGLATNDQSGVEIDGFPGGVNSNEYEMHKKFLKWNYGTNGTLDLGTSNLNTESFWDLQGGALRITKKKNYGTVGTPNIKELSFGFRINENDELEFYKKFWSTGASQYVYKRLTKFGRIL